MRPSYLCLDDFLPNYDAAREYLDHAEFEQNKENPHDHLIYPEIIDFPDDKFGIENQLSLVFGCRIGLQAIIARLSLKDVKPPYAVHSDAFMGCQYTCIIYMTRDEHIQAGAGTVLCRDWVTKEETYTGLPQDLDGAKLENSLAGLSKRWETVTRCEMKSNRAFIFPSDRLHYSSPYWGGFGTDQTNGRLVLAVLFSLAGLTT